MRAWWCTVESVVEAEFPSHEVLRSFAVFLVSDGDRSGLASHVPEDFAVEHFDRIALAIRVDPIKLKDEISLARPLAASFQRQSKTSTMVAWRYAFDRFEKRGPKMKAARMAAAIAMVWLPITAGVEHDFSTHRAVVKCSRRKMEETLEQDLMKVVADYKADEEEEIIERARALWRGIYKSSRSAPALRRRDLGRRKANCIYIYIYIYICALFLFMLSPMLSLSVSL